MDMSEGDTLRRVDKLEEEISRLVGIISELSTAIAVLNKTVESMSQAEQRRAALREKTILFVIGGFISAGIAWVVGGGLSS